MKTLHTRLLITLLITALFASACLNNGTPPPTPDQIQAAQTQGAQIVLEAQKKKDAEDAKKAADKVLDDSKATAQAILGAPMVPTVAPAVTAVPGATSAPGSTPATVSTARPGAPAPASGKWVHNPALPAVAGYPGWLRQADQQHTDGLKRNVEITLRQDQVALIFGDSANIPSIGNVGGQDAVNSGCYLVVFRGPYIWDTQPAAGEWPPITFQNRSSWELHDVDASANATQWAAAKAKALVDSYPQTCGKSIDVWVKQP